MIESVAGQGAEGSLWRGTFAAPRFRPGTGFLDDVKTVKNAFESRSTTW